MLQRIVLHRGSEPASLIEMVLFCVVQVWEMEWDVSGMTLATSGRDGVVRVWQSNLSGTWHQQALLEPTS